VMQFLDAASKTRMAATCKRFRHEATAEFAWRGTPLVLRNSKYSFRQQHPLGRSVLSSHVPLFLVYDAPSPIDARITNAPGLQGLDVGHDSRPPQLFALPWSHRMRWLRLPHLMNSIMFDPAHGTYRMEFYREVFDIVAQSFTQLRTLIMPHQYAQQQIEGLLERMPPHLTELGCTVLVWPLFAPLPSIRQLRSLHLFHGQFHKGGIGLDPARLAHLSSLQLSNLDCNSDDPDKFNIKVEDADDLRQAALAPLKLFPLATVFAGLSSLRTLTLPCIPHIELLLAHVHLCPSLGLLQLQWVGLSKKCGVVPASLSHPTPASVLQLLQEAPSLRVHFVHACAWMGVV